MKWNKTTEPKRIGWYLCTMSLGCSRFVMPIHRSEYPEGNFYWEHDGDSKIIACAKFPEPYKGEINND